MRFLHTADWQIGKPFQSIIDTAKRESLRNQRIETIKSLRDLIERESLDFVLVCGDLFDSATPDQPTVSALCSAVGSLGVPVYAIPGNHDHGGPGCIWEQSFFQREQAELAPNLKVFLKPEPVILDGAVLLPCPLLRRHESQDPTAWLRNEPDDLPAGLPRIVLAHGSTQGFSSSGDIDGATDINRIELERLPDDAYDYIAMGDWHGLKEITTRAWFSGTPEQDRFAKGESNQPGQVLTVAITQRGAAPEIRPIRTGTVGWHAPEPFHLSSDLDFDALSAHIEACIGTRAGRDLLKLSVAGTLSFAGIERFEQLAESLRARLIRLELDRNIQVEPSAEELDALSERQDPLIAQVAKELRESLETDPLARDALRELHLETGRIEQ